MEAFLEPLFGGSEQLSHYNFLDFLKVLKYCSFQMRLIFGKREKLQEIWGISGCQTYGIVCLPKCCCNIYIYIITLLYISCLHNDIYKTKQWGNVLFILMILKMVTLQFPVAGEKRELYNCTFVPRTLELGIHKQVFSY